MHLKINGHIVQVDNTGIDVFSEVVLIHLQILFSAHFFLNSHHFGLNFLLSVFILSKKIKLVSFLT